MGLAGALWLPLRLVCGANLYTNVHDFRNGFQVLFVVDRAVLDVGI